LAWPEVDREPWLKEVLVMAAGMIRKAVDTAEIGEISGAAAIRGLAGVIKRVAAMGEAEATTAAVGSIVAAEDASWGATSRVGEWV
jgi:hypothetical protein